MSESALRVGARWRIRAVLVAAFALAYIAFLGPRPMGLPDEVRYAEIGREILASGDWVVPRLLGMHYFEKPIGGYWMIALSMKIFGESSFALRLPSALATGGAALLVFLLTRRAIRDERVALTAVAVYLSSIVVFAIGTYGVLDPMLALATLASLFAIWRTYEAPGRGARLRWWTLLGVACGFGFLIKGFVALVIPVVVAVPFLVWTGRWRQLLGYGPLAILAAAIVAGPWSLLVHLRAPDFWNFFFWHEHVRRFASENAQHEQPFWFYVPVLAGISLPWLAIVPSSLVRAARRAFRQNDAFALFLVLAFAMPALFFSCAKGKLVTYVLPCWAPLSILIAISVVDRLANKRLGALRGAAATVLGFGLAGLSVLAAVSLLGKTKYGAGEPLVLLAFAIVLLAWCALGIACLRGRIHPTLAIASMTLCLAPAYPFLAPRELQCAKAPERILQQNLNLVPSDAVVASASVKLAPALAWELGRPDVTIVGGTGELAYGIATPEGAGRCVPKDEVGDWIAGTITERPLALFLLDRDPSAADAYPAPDRLERNGRLAMLLYDRR